MVIDGLLIGFIVSASAVASIFFFKFWRTTRDILFLAFAVSFVIEGLSRLIYVFIANPSDSIPTIYIARLIGYLIILAAIFGKNRKSLFK